MHLLDYHGLEQRVVEGVKGTLTALDVTNDETFGCGIRVIPPNSKVPKPGTPYAKGRRILFVMRGSGTVTNGEYYEKVAAGKFVQLEDGEHPTFMTQEDELVVLEIRWNPLGRMLPPTVAITMPMTVDATPRTPRVTSYDET